MEVAHLETTMRYVCLTAWRLQHAKMEGEDVHGRCHHWNGISVYLGTQWHFIPWIDRGGGEGSLTKKEYCINVFSVLNEWKVLQTFRTSMLR